MIGYINEIRCSQYGKKAYGFISVDGERERYFFHKNDLRNCTIYQLEEGDVVEFNADLSHERGQAAKEVRKKYQAKPEASKANPGINPQVVLDHFNEDEKNIIQFLGDVFYVTSGGNEFVMGGNSIYRYCLIKPTDYFVRTFQLSREIVVIFSDYVHFEPRSLDAASYVYKSMASQLRLDRGCHLLICHDNEIETSLVELLKDNNVNQIVIPFTYSELLSRDVNENIVREKFRKYLFDIDLFATSMPITNDIFFFGRRDLVHDIVSKCKNNTNCGVFGLRRSGKTSVLYAVRFLLKQQAHRTVFVTCESDLSSLDWRTALYQVVYNVYAEMGMNPKAIDKKKYQSFDTVVYFEQDMFECLKDSVYPVTIMFDEIEAITFSVTQGEKSENLWLDGDGFVNFWNTMKGYYSKHPRQLSLLIAGTNPMINEEPSVGKKHLANPMFRQLSESNQGAYLQAFSIDDTKNMVNTLGGYMGLTFNEYSIAKLTSDCGGHPYLMRILCSYNNKYLRTNNISRPAVITKAIYDKVMPEFERSSEATSFFWMILNILMTSYPKEFETLKILALEGDGIISKIQGTDALLHLLGYGLVECNQNNYAIKYNVITRFLKGEYRFERVGLCIEEQKQEIQLRINNAEMQLRKLVKNALLSVNGTTKARQLIVTAMEGNSAISTEDVKRAESLTYPQLFDPSMNKIYFSLLKDIILKNLSLFANVFEDCGFKTIENHLSIINLARRCPDHSYTEDVGKWSWDNFLEFRNSIGWLEDILKNFE